MDDGLGEDDFANFEVDLFIFEDLNLLNPAADANILEDVDGDVNYCWLTRTLTQVHSFNNKIIISMKI